jgi:RNA polymerase sigma-70 factor (ECF subfamily)
MVIDWYRKKKPTSYDALEEQGFEASDATSSSSLQDAELREIFAVIEDLEVKDREVLLLRYAEGLDPKDIAEILGESANVVSVRINRAIEKVKKKLSV